MCFFTSQPEAPPTPAPAPAPAPAAEPLDLKLNKDDKLSSEIGKRNRAGKRRFRVDRQRNSEGAQMDFSGFGGTAGGLQIKDRN